MCIIIDANVRDDLFGKSPSPDAIPVYDWIAKNGGIAVLGGKLKTELYQAKNAGRTLRVWKEAGRVIEVPEGDIDDGIKRLQGCNLESDDIHIIALAIKSKARLLYTNDDKLIADFKNRNLIARPRGKIYRHARQSRNLLNGSACSNC